MLFCFIPSRALFFSLHFLFFFPDISVLLLLLQKKNPHKCGGKLLTYFALIGSVSVHFKKKKKNKLKKTYTIWIEGSKKEWFYNFPVTCLRELKLVNFRVHVCAHCRIYKANILFFLFKSVTYLRRVKRRDRCSTFM